MDPIVKGWFAEALMVLGPLSDLSESGQRYLYYLRADDFFKSRARVGWGWYASWFVKWQQRGDEGDV